MNATFKVIGLTRFGNKPESTAPGADALTPWPSKLKIKNVNSEEFRGRGLQTAKG